ncbi:MAG: DUF1294 domain-containing protein [Comamonadaceae bacterium]|nr:MAG: DUF1294 domain-containing protein [Comamonadaceae bacterium]
MASTRKVGNVRRWDATRGFGFIRGPGDGADVFFHVRDWRGGTPPHEGMTVNFEEIHIGGKGPRAMAVQLHNAAEATAAWSRAHPTRATRATRARRAARPAAHSRSPAWWWFALLVWVGALATACYLQRMPLWALGALLAINVVTFFTYMFDKSAAERDAQRTPENTLHMLSLVGGWPGGRLAQQLFRHKSSKQSFQRAYAATVFLNLAALLGWFYGASRPS